jgi:hypothetical protein
MRYTSLMEHEFSFAEVRHRDVVRGGRSLWQEWRMDRLQVQVHHLE